jgi:hypothetical protein
MDGGRYEEAYGLLGEGLRQLRSLPKFVEEERSFNDAAGPVISREISKITWTKDPPNAPKPGVYAAVDLVSRFRNIDRHCGYIILYQEPSGGSFEVTREEGTFMDNATALKAEQDHSLAYVRETWRRISRVCPNYQADISDAPLKEDPRASVGYTTVAEALESLEKKPGVSVTVTKPDGWTIISEPSTFSVWSFTPKGHYAHPAVVRRTAKQNPAGGVDMEMTVHCEADKSSCDRLVREFKILNDRAAESIRRSHQTQGQH